MVRYLGIDVNDALEMAEDTECASFTRRSHKFPIIHAYQD